MNMRVWIHSPVCSGRWSTSGARPYTLQFIPLVGSLTEPGARVAASKPQTSLCLSYSSLNRDPVVVMGEGCTRKSVPMPICPHRLSLFIWVLGT